MAPTPDALLAMTEAELDLQMGEMLFADEFGAKEPSEADKRQRALHWFAAQRAQLAQAVCPLPAVQRYLKQKDAIERELFDAVLSAVAALAGVPVPVGVLAAKIVRFGVGNLCPCNDAPAAGG